MDKEVFIESINKGTSANTFTGVATNRDASKTWKFTDVPFFQKGAPITDPSQCPPPSLVTVTLDGGNPKQADLLVFANGENWEKLEPETQQSYRVATDRTGKDMNGLGLSIRKV
jgi:hypothetical protein